MDTLYIAAGLLCAGYAAWEIRDVLRARPLPENRQIEGKELSMDTKKLMAAETALINRMFADHGVDARISKKLTAEVKSSFISYGLKLGPGESLKHVEDIRRELSNDLTRQRVRMMRGYAGRAVVRVRDYPLAIEVPHPCPTPLSWHSASIRMARNYALIGRSYSYTGAREEYIDLDRHHHTLIAAMSGGGKSTMMRMALLTLALNTPTDELRIMLIDLKNDDLVPFRALPHTVGYAGDIESASGVIECVHQVKTERIASREKPYRMLLVIDELAELGPDKEALRKLGSILSTGRSLGINVWAGTQYPSAASIGSVVSASFTTRLVGMVDGKNSANVATKRAGSGAEMLTLPGDFLRVDGGDLVRMKSYNIDDDDTAMLIKQIAGKKTAGIVTIPATVKRNEVAELAGKISEMYANGASKRSMAMYAFGKQYGGSIAAKIDEAIELLQGQGATESATTTGATTASYTSEVISSPSSSSTNGNGEIINMATRRLARGA